MGLRLQSWLAVTRAALGIVCRREHLRRTIPIALVVGVVLTAINQLDVILAGDATAVTAVKCGLNFCVPFVVSNFGLLAGRRHELAAGSAAAAAATGAQGSTAGEPARRA